VQNWMKKGDVDDETHIATLKKKIEAHHTAVMRALAKVPVYQNQLWAMEQLVKKKKAAAERRDVKAAERAQRLEKERLDKLRREEDDLEAKKVLSRPLQPMNRKRASSDEGSSDEEDRKHVEKKKRTPKQKPKADPVTRNPPKAYQPQNQQEWDRWNAFTGYSENEWRYSLEHGTEALECLVARGLNQLIPEILPGQHTPKIEPVLVPVRIAAEFPNAVHEAAAEALPDSPLSDGGSVISQLASISKRLMFL